MSLGNSNISILPALIIMKFQKELTNHDMYIRSNAETEELRKMILARKRLPVIKMAEINIRMKPSIL
jgi:uncharacterized membrane protein